MIKKNILAFIVAAMFVLQPLLAFPSAAGDKSRWFTEDSEGGVGVKLYFFASRNCPHCQKAKPFLEKLDSEFPWLHVQHKEVVDHPENARLFVEMAKELGEESLSVPAFFYCGKVFFGYGADETTGKFLREEILTCRQEVIEGIGGREKEMASKKESAVINIPFFGGIDASNFSLPVFTLIIAGIDAFNPCAFFVLLFLLSLMVHANSRLRMFLIGGTFVVISGVVYFAFMAAWLNVFLYIGEIKAVTIVAGFLAVTISLINIKDFFWFKKGVSLNIPDSVKPTLYQRVRGLINLTSIPYLLVGTVFLALAANTYELLCTAGFPMVFTRVLTLNQLPVYQYYTYLFYYNVIYVIPLSVIVLVFTLTLGSRKLKEEEGRTLKLLSGLMMLSLGLLLLLAPDLLSNVLTAITLLIFSIVLTFIILRLERVRKSNNAGPA